MRAWLSLIPLLLISGAASAETVVLQNFTLIDGTGKSAVPNAAMVVTDGRIRYAGPKAKLPAQPQGATTLDLTGKYVMPGIINLHGHLGNVKGLVQDPVNYTPENLDANLKTYAQYGVTTVVSMGSDQDLLLQRRAEQRATGRPKTTRIYTAYRGFTGIAGYPTSAPGMKGVPFEVATKAEVVKDVAILADKKVDLVKIWVDDHFGKERKIPLDLSADIIAEAHKHGLKVGAHIFYYDDAKNLVDRGLNALLHSVRDKDVDDAFIASMKKNNAWMAAATFTRELSAFAYAKPPEWLKDTFFSRSVTPDVIKTLSTPGQKAVASDPRFETGLQVAKRNLKRLVDAGVKYGFGTDTGPPGRFPGYFEHVEMQMMAEAGLTPSQIIQAASKNSAEFLGASKDLGTLEAGKWADLIVLGRNPLDDIRNTRSIETVMIAGQKVN
ncbi:MAG: amidohydrolase family protein [Bryobacteraceae bacterium]|nr:amidohydrolase family protein [Bryobacteraceae bacterium]